MTSRIEDYALIGDTQSAALVSRNGSLDGCACRASIQPPVLRPSSARRRTAAGCLSRPPIFGGSHAGTRDDTLILETDYETADGAITVIDFMHATTSG